MIKKNRKLMATLLGLSSTLGAAAIVAPIAVNQISTSRNVNTNNVGLTGGTIGSDDGWTSVPGIDVSQPSQENESNVNFANLNNGIIKSNSLSFQAKSPRGSFGNETRNANRYSLNKTTDVKGWKEVTLEDGSKERQYESDLYVNNREYMPILGKKNGTMYNQRERIDILNHNYYGWNKLNLGDHYNGVKGAFLYLYQPTQILRSTFSDKTLTDVKTLHLNAALIRKHNNNEQLPSLIKNIFANTNPDHVIIDSWDGASAKELLESDINGMYSDKTKSLKKLTIVSNSEWGIVDLDWIKIPETVKEIELYTPGIRKVNPLWFPESANLIWDTESYSFTSVDLRTQANMTTEELQKAINLTYKTFINNRYFQNEWAGGYISHWDLRNTGITTLNNVEIPTLNDGTGRFYIGSVWVDSGGSGPIVDEIIGSGDKPSNDSQVGEWFDWNEEGWQKVEEVIVTMENDEPVVFEKAVKEVAGFIKKYPNVNKIDISGLVFTDLTKTHDELIEQVKSMSNPLVFNKITFVKLSDIITR